MRSEEGDHLARHLEVGNVSVQIEPVDAGKVEAHMSLEHFIDVCHTRHATSVPARGSALPARLSQRSTRARREEAGRGACPLPANVLSPEAAPEITELGCGNDGGRRWD